MVTNRASEKTLLMSSNRKSYLVAFDCHIYIFTLVHSEDRQGHSQFDCREKKIKPSYTAFCHMPASTPPFAYLDIISYWIDTTMEQYFGQISQQ